jgi:hypothetical protein
VSFLERSLVPMERGYPRNNTVSVQSISFKIVPMELLTPIGTSLLLKVRHFLLKNDTKVEKPPSAKLAVPAQTGFVVPLRAKCASVKGTINIINKKETRSALNHELIEERRRTITELYPAFVRQINVCLRCKCIDISNVVAISVSEQSSMRIANQHCSKVTNCKL